MSEFAFDDDFLPIYDVSDAVATVADADRESAWRALVDVDLLKLGREAPCALCRRRRHGQCDRSEHQRRTALARWWGCSVRALLGGRLLRPDLLQAMGTTVPARQLGRGNAYGLGLQKLPERCGAAWGHTGASPGYSADALNRKNGRRQVVPLINATGPLGAAGFFGPPTSAEPAIERLIRAA